MKFTAQQILIYIFISFFGLSQETQLEFNFYTLEERFGVFEVTNDKDTSIVIGGYLLKDDTIYFKEIQGVLIENRSFHALNMSMNYSNKTEVAYPSHIIPDKITSMFYYLGGLNEVVHFDEFDYILDDSLRINYNNKNRFDTMHYVSFVPRQYTNFRIEAENMKSNNLFIGNPYFLMRTRKNKKKKSALMIPDFWLFEFNVYFSDIKFDFDLKNTVGDILRLGNRDYTIIFN